MNLEINKLDLMPEEIDDFRLQFGQRAPEALARDVVKTFADQDYAAQIQNDPNFFSYEKLQDGTATFYDFLSPDYTVTMEGPDGAEERPIRDLNPVQRSIFFKDPDSISSLLTTAEKGSLSRAFFSEFFKTAPSVAAGTKAAQLTAAQTFRTPPKSLPGFMLRAAPVAASFIGGSLLLYEGADALEELATGPDKPILPGQKQAVETVRTLGGAGAGIQFPFLFKEAGSRVARDIIKNLAEDAPVPTATKFTATIEEMLENMGRTARGSKTGAALTVGVESAAGAGSAGGAYVAEGMEPGGTGLRLGSEFLGGNMFGLAFAKMLPKAYSNLRETGADKEASSFLTKISEGKKKKLFARIDELYTKYDGDYERMMNDLNNEETNKILQEVFPGVDFTAAQRLEDNTGIIMGLEGEMATKNPDLLAARKKAERNAKTFFDKFIYGLVEENTPESLRTAAILRKALMSDMMSRRLLNAVDARISARNRVLTGDERSGTPKARSSFSLELADLLETQLAFARAREKELWSKTGGVDVFTPSEVIDGDVMPSFITKYEEFINELPAGYKEEFIKATGGLDSFVRDAKRRLGLDIKESIAEQNAIIQSVDAQDSDPVALIRTKFEIPLSGAPLNRQIDRMQNLISEIDKGRFVGVGEEIQTLNPETGATTTGQFSIDLKKGSESQKNFLKVARAKLALLKLEQAKLDPNRVAPVSAKELFEVRSEVLNSAALVASGAVLRRGTANQARKLGEVAEAILDDLNRMPDSELDAFNKAKAFSASLNDVYTRSIVGKARSKDAMRGNRIPPELLISTFVRSNPDMVDLRVQQLQGVAKFAEQQGFEGADSVFTSVNNIMEGAIRTLRLQAMNPDGSINAGALERFKRDNAELMETFPNLKSDLDNAVSAQRTVETFEKRSEAAKKISDSQAYLATLIGNSSPHLALTEALNFTPKNAKQADPIGGLRRLFRLTSVKYKGPDGKFLPAAEQTAMREKINEGYFNTILQHAMMESGGEGKTFDHVTFHRTLFEPLPGQGAGKLSLMDLAEDYGIMDKNQIRRIRTISNQMVRLAVADAAGKLADPDLIKQAGPLFDFYVGMVGLAGGTKAYQALTGGTGGTASISAAGYTKGIALDFFKNIPASKRMEAIQMIFTDPEVAATLIRKPKNEKEGVKQTERIVKLLTEKGFLTFGEMSPYLIREAGEDEDVGTGRTTPIPTPQGMSVSSVAPQPVPAQRVAPPTSTLASAAPVAPPPAASGPVNREQYAALFPNDLASGMIRQQRTTLMADGGAVKHFATGGRADGPNSESEGHSSHGFGDPNNDLGDQDRSMTIEERYRDNAERLRRAGVKTTPYVSSDQGQPMTVSHRYLDNAARITPTVVTTPSEQVQNSLDRAGILSNISNLAATSLANKTAPDVVSDFQNRLASGQFDKVPTTPAQARAEALRANNPTVASFAQPAPVAGPFGITTSTLNAVTNQPIGIGTLAPSSKPFSVQVGPGTFTPSYDPATQSVMGTYQMRFARGGAVHGGIASMIRRSR